MAVHIYGDIWDGNCSSQTGVDLVKPLSGYKNRKSLKCIYRGWGTMYQTQTDHLFAAFETPDPAISALVTVNK